MKRMKWVGLGCLALVMTFTITACDKDDDDPEPNNLSAADRDFMRQAAYGNRAEVELGRLAAGKGNSAAVRDFGQHMVTDHTKSLRELDSLADRWNVDLPDELDSLHKAMRQMLNTYTGYQFDTAYINGQIRDHIININLYQTEAANGQEQKLKDYATRTLPHLVEHRAKADSVRAVIR